MSGYWHHSAVCPSVRDAVVLRVGVGGVKVVPSWS